MPKQIIQLVWMPPEKLTVENFDADEFKIKTEDGLVKLISTADGIVRIMPASQVRLIQFITPEEKPTIITPDNLEEFKRGPAQ